MTPRRLSTLVLLAALVIAAPLAARPGGWDSPGWGGPGWGAPRWGSARDIRPDRSRDGKVEVASFRAAGEVAGALGQGAIAVAAAPGALGSERELATYEAAVVDRLVRAGYDSTAAGASAQVAEFRITHTQIEPQAPPHRPVSGAMTMGVSNRGTMMGMAVNV
ncbi:MAG: hypothetical protein JF593_15705, partial [Novosphingobium sp.]|nr:hypothetical protein [Novosphingobium sp.]